jgi:hypothetical protein
MRAVFNPFTSQLQLINDAGGGGGSLTGGGVANQIAYWSSATGLTSDATFSVDAVNKLLKLTSGLDVAEISALSSESIAAGVAANQLLFSFPQSKNFCVVEYSAVRGSNYRLGTLLVTNDGTNINVIDTFSEIGDTQLELASPAVSHTFNGGNVEIRYNSAGGLAGTFKKLMRRWA